MDTESGMKMAINSAWTYKIKLTFHNSPLRGRYIIPLRKLGAKFPGIHIHIGHKCLIIEWEKVYR